MGATISNFVRDSAIAPRRACTLLFRVREAFFGGSIEMNSRRTPPSACHPRHTEQPPSSTREEGEGEEVGANTTVKA